MIVFGREEFGHEALHQGFHFFVRKAGGAARFLVHGHDGIVYLANGGVLFGYLLVAPQIEVGVDPVGNTGAARLVGNNDGHGAAKQMIGVEDIVDFFVLGQTVGVYARAGGVKVAAHKGIVVGNAVVQFFFKELGNFAQNGGVGGGVVARKRNVLYQQGFKRGVARAFAKAKQRAVDRAAAIQPRGNAIDEHLVEVVVPVPFKPFAGHTGLVGKAAHNALHRAGQRRAGVGHTVAHGVAQANLDRHAALARELHEPLGQGQAKAVNVGAGHVFKVAAGYDAPFQGLFGHAHIHVHGLLAGFAQLEKNMVVRNAGEHAGFVKFHIAGKLEVFLGGANPGGYTRKTVASGAAHINALAVFGRVQKKFRSRDEPGFSAQSVQKIEHLGHLLDRIGGAGLLAIAKGRVGNAHLFCRSGRQQNLVKRGTANAGVREKLTVELRFFRLLHDQGTAASSLVNNVAHWVSALSRGGRAVKIVAVSR